MSNRPYGVTSASSSLSWRTPPPLRDGWLGRSASTLTKRTCLEAELWGRVIHESCYTRDFTVPLVSKRILIASLKTPHSGGTLPTQDMPTHGSACFDFCALFLFFFFFLGFSGCFYCFD